MRESGAIPRPDWVIVGTPWEEGVLVLASDQLTQAELEREVEAIYSLDIDFMMGVPTYYSLRVEMQKFVLITGATYAEAMARLMRQWEPKAPERPEIGGRLGLTS